MHGDQEIESRAADMPEIMSREEVVAAFRAAMTGHFRTHAEGTGVNETTLLASDYLDRFQDLAGLLETVSVQLQDFADEFLSWEPMTYEEHFAEAESGDGNLAVAAYRQSPPPTRARFDEAVSRLHDEALTQIGDVVAKLSGSKQGLNQACDNAAACLRILIDEANAIAMGETLPSRHEQDSADNVIYAKFGRR